MNKVLLFLAIPALVVSALFMLGLLVLGFFLVPPVTIPPALLLLAGGAALVVLKVRGRGAGNSLDGEAALLPSAKSKGGLL